MKIEIKVDNHELLPAAVQVEVFQKELQRAVQLVLQRNGMGAQHIAVRTS